MSTPFPLAAASDGDLLHGRGSTADAEAGQSLPALQRARAVLHGSASGGHAFLARRAEQREEQGRRELVWAPREAAGLLQEHAAPTREPYPHRNRAQTKFFVQEPPRAHIRKPALRTASSDTRDPSAVRPGAAPLPAAFGSALARRSRLGVVRPGQPVS